MAFRVLLSFSSPLELLHDSVTEDVGGEMIP